MKGGEGMFIEGRGWVSGAPSVQREDAIRSRDDSPPARVVPPPWPSRGPSEPPTLEEVQAGHIHWMMSCPDWGWVQVRMVLDDGIMICADDAMMDHRWDVRVQLAGHPVKQDSVRRFADWRRCTNNGRPLPLPMWRGPSGETTTKPHPSEPGWTVEKA